MRMSTLFAMPLLLILPSPAAQNAIYDGKPTFAEGTELGYYLWRDRLGNLACVRHLLGPPRFVAEDLG